jgi:hypothetical protein
MHATALELDEEEHERRRRRDRLNGEEVAGEDSCGLVTEKLSPARPRAPRRRPKSGGQQDAPDRARRAAQAELEQLPGDPRIAPARVLACKAQYELLHRAIDRRPAGSPPAAASICGARTPDASAEASAASPPSRGAAAGSSRPSAASKARSAGRNEGRGCCRPSTTS